MLGWSPRPGADRPADILLGQPDFGDAREWPYGPHTADRFRFPYAVGLDAGGPAGRRLAVADTANNRVLLWDDPEQPWLGGRWVVRTEGGQRFPLTLSMMMFDSSGVNKEAARREHLEALNSVIVSARTAEADPLAVACAVDWLLYDWLMAHRDGPDSGEIVFPKGHEADAAVVVAAAATSVAARSTFDPGLVGLGPVRR